VDTGSPGGRKYNGGSVWLGKGRLGTAGEALHLLDQRRPNGCVLSRRRVARNRGDDRREAEPEAKNRRWGWWYKQ